MSKAILVIDVPQEDIGKLASIMYLGNDKFLQSIEFIPIQPMPRKAETDNEFARGWNWCLEEITR